MTYIRVEVVSVGGYADPWSSVGDALHGDVGRKVQPQEEGVELCKSSPEGVSDLDKTEGEHHLPKKPLDKLTTTTEVAPLEPIKSVTSPRMVFAVALWASLNPWCT